MPIIGGCQCKTVQYSVDAIEGDMWNCFCQTCRKSHSADHNIAAKVKREHFHLHKGADALRSFESTPGKLRWFCGTCGSHIYAERPAQPEAVVLRAGSFDSDPGSKPAFNVWKSHALPWLEHDDTITNYPEFATP